MERKEFETLVDAFEHAYDKLGATVGALGKEEMTFVPPIADAWSINEHLVHLLDADCNLVMRIRGAVAEPGKQVPVWDQEAWHAKNNYAKSDGPACFNLAVALRKFIAQSLRSLDDSTRGAAFIVHPERGKMTLTDVLAVYTGHADFHLKYVARNLEAFAKK